MPKKDATSDIDGTPCKKVCLLKNGKTVTQEIDENECKIFVVSASMTASCIIAAGVKDIALLATPKKNFAQGNPFFITKI